MCTGRVPSSPAKRPGLRSEPLFNAVALTGVGPAPHTSNTASALHDP